ncbi:MAG: DUF2723 domain-containing protein [Paludibacteraceae bacterium]|nr:DUF2723 domain-containing protein [Paludibacteraceae bacterium]MBP6285119.1 DUF2723 domain-containing protein [Paludibacteraceae bacterium]
MKSFKTMNTLVGWASFFIAWIVYALTIEPTASFWDCGEFITSAFKLEVGHPPGAPFFNLTGNFFTLFASSPSQVAIMVNLMSATLSALTILLLFWTITHIAKKTMVDDTETPSLSQQISIIGSGLIGALVYTFSDTFWFSAAEAEVYAYSSFFTSLVFWLILKWDDKHDNARSDKYLILIAYLMGLSIGVHLLNLLTIPAIVLVYYYRKTSNPTWKSSLWAIFLSFAILAFIMYGFIPQFIANAGITELLFVNTLGFSFNSGAIFYYLLTVAVLVWSNIELYKKQPSSLRIKISFIASLVLLGIPFLLGSLWIGIILTAALIVYFTKQKDNISIRLLSTIIISLTMMLIGYSSYALIVIRSAANPPMDQNSPENIFTLQSYLNREQYGDRPLFYGAYYSAEPKLIEESGYCKPVIIEGAKTWGVAEKTEATDKDTYIVIGTKYDLEYDSQFKTIFPRLHSSNENHIKAYKGWINIEGKKVRYDKCGNVMDVVVPTFGENLEFFFSYQVNYMYWRYFMWNFSGRQNDLQGSGEITRGNWITGFNFIDKHMVGDQTNLPAELSENKAHNTYYMLPLILGLIGIAYQIAMSGKKGQQAFWVIGWLFFMTGIAIVMYLNQGPSEPRERDYAYAGSFYAFAIWIGFGVAGIAKWLESKKINPTLAAIIAVLVALPAPLIMAQQNWDDHDRSDRYIVRDFALNYFNSLAPNAIIFTNGDNDTFPLWYTQEVEGTEVSMDKRVCNLSYLNTDWYIDQMKRPSYASAPLPISWDRKTYGEGKRNYAYAYNLTPGDVEMVDALRFLASDDPRTKRDPRTGDTRDFIPATSLKLSVNADNLVKQGAITEQEKNDILPALTLQLKDRQLLTKSELMILDILAQNNWERPIYYAVTVGSDMHLGLRPYFQLEGLAYRIVPRTDSIPTGTVNTTLMYDNMMNKFNFGGIENPSVYLDENMMRMAKVQRQMFSALIGALIDEGDSIKALKALEYCMKVIPGETVPHDFSSATLAEYYYTLGEKEKAAAIINTVADRAIGYLEWISQLTPSQRASAAYDMHMQLSALQNVAFATRYNDEELFEKHYNSFMLYAERFNRMLQ